MPVSLCDWREVRLFHIVRVNKGGVYLDFTMSYFEAACKKYECLMLKVVSWFARGNIPVLGREKRWGFEKLVCKFHTFLVLCQSCLQKGAMQ